MNHVPIHPGWYRATQWTALDYVRVKRDHPSWFPDAEQTRRWWREDTV